jgi:ParB-like chromosome segregation protein Spo0J
VKPIHPLCARLPGMAADEYAELVESVRANGLHEPIWLYEGQILDGRHRARACEAAGVEPEYAEYCGENPAAFVLDMAVHRRMLDAGQRAVVVLDLLPELEAEAKRRQGARMDRIDVGSTSAGKPADVDKPRRASDDAAEMVDVRPSKVQEAKYVQKHAPELLDDVRSGEMKLGAAVRKVKEKAAVKYPVFWGTELAKALTRIGEIYAHKDEIVADSRTRPDRVSDIHALEWTENKLKHIREGIESVEKGTT